MPRSMWLQDTIRIPLYLVEWSASLKMSIVWGVLFKSFELTLVSFHELEYFPKDRYICDKGWWWTKENNIKWSPLYYRQTGIRQWAALPLVRSSHVCVWKHYVEWTNGVSYFRQSLTYGRSLLWWIILHTCVCFEVSLVQNLFL